MAKEIFINRVFQNDHKTLSVAGVMNEPDYLYEFTTIELPWRDNTRGISCIPEGTYQGESILKSNNKYAILLKDVPDRDGIFISSANFVRQLEGCISPGTKDKDGVIDTVSSRVALGTLETIFPVGSEMKIHIKDVFKIHGNATSI